MQHTAAGNYAGVSALVIFDVIVVNDSDNMIATIFNYYTYYYYFVFI